MSQLTIDAKAIPVLLRALEAYDSLLRRRVNTLAISTSPAALRKIEESLADQRVARALADRMNDEIDRGSDFGIAMRAAGAKLTGNACCEHAAINNQDCPIHRR